MKKQLLLKLAISYMFFVGCNNHKETITPTLSNITESVYASGIIKSEHQYEVYAKMNGVVETIFFKEGELVKKGDPVFQIANTNSKISVENARLSAIANDFKENRAKLADAKNTVELAKKKLANDSSLYFRQQELWRKNIGSKVELERQELNYENAKLNLKKAELTYEDVNRQLNLVSDQSKNNLKIAQSTENDFFVRSEIDGFVYKINIKQGELASTAYPLAVIGQKNFIVELYVDEFDIVKIKKGQKVIIRMDSYQDEVFEAQISFIYPMMNDRTRTFKLEAVFSKKPELLYPNLSLEANIILNEKKNVLTIPTNYLLNDSSVMLEDGVIKNVKIGLKDYTLTEIESGIDMNTKIVMPKK